MFFAGSLARDKDHANYEILGKRSLVKGARVEFDYAYLLIMGRKFMENLTWEMCIYRPKRAREGV